MFGPIKQEPERVCFSTESIPSTPMKKLEGGFDYDQLLEMNMAMLSVTKVTILSDLTIIRGLISRGKRHWRKKRLANE